jgi:hypothetical protein
VCTGAFPPGPAAYPPTVPDLEPDLDPDLDPDLAPAREPRGLRWGKTAPNGHPYMKHTATNRAKSRV